MKIGKILSCLAIVSASFSASALSSANPLSRPVTSASVDSGPGPGSQVMPLPTPYPSPVRGSAAPLLLPAGSSYKVPGPTDNAERDESQAVAGLYVSVVMGQRAVLRSEAIQSSPGAPIAPSFAPMNATTLPSAAGANAAPVRGIVYRLNHGETAQLSDGTKVKVAINEANVSLTSIATKRILFSGQVGSMTNASEYTPPDVALVKPDGKYARNSFIKPLAAPVIANGSTRGGAQ